MIEPNPLPSRRIDGFVYIITDGEYYKIGITSAWVDKRMSEIQTFNPKALRLVYKKKIGFYFDYEHLLHKIFDSKRLRGEWFTLTEEDLSYAKDVINGLHYTRVGPRSFVLNHKKTESGVVLKRGKGHANKQ